MSEGRTPILYIAPWVDLGGSDKGTIDWFRSIDRGRWAPSLITTQPSANRWLYRLEPLAEEVWNLPDLMPGDGFAEFILGFVESRGVRVVHIMNSKLGFDLLPEMTRLAEPPSVVVQLHAEEPNQAGYVRYATRRYANLIDAFSVTSRNLEATVAAYDIPPSRIEVIHSGVDADQEFNPANVEPWERPGGVSRVLWPGRLVDQKDPMLTLEVIARARERGAEFVLDIVGDGHLEDAVRRRAEQLGVAGLIEWHPPSQEMARWYRSADLLLMTSAYEGVPYVIYESLAMGVPVVAPGLPGNREFMDADSGALVEPRDDVEGYAEAIVELLADGERRRRMGERSRRRMLEDFSLAEMGRRHGALYERLLTAGRASRSTPEPETGGASPPTLRLQRDPPPERTLGVIVPCYRHGTFLGGCIDSIKAQTLPPERIVVVDDGSDDVETLEALARLERDPEVSVLRQPGNLGPSAARNRALTELDTSYVLPIDADDELLPNALETMVTQLESAPEDIGFVYPNVQYMGNQSNYVGSPAYNLWLLMQQNYCPAPALFDRRVFDGTGVRYPEEMRVGHEDWDLILQLAERGLRGLVADGPTFRYRKQGFSRANAVDYAPDAFYEAIEERHPRLYEDGDAIKASWSPALSVVLLDDDDRAWTEADLAGLSDQRCRDFELLSQTASIEGAVAVSAQAGSPLVWLQEAIHRARGRWVLLLPRSVADLLNDRIFVDCLLRALLANHGVLGAVFAESADETRPSLAQLDDEERLAASPAAVAFERRSWGRMPELPLSSKYPPLAAIAIGLQAQGPLQWRAVRASRPGPPWRTRQPGSSAGPPALDINLPPGDGPELAARKMMLHQPPRLPELVSRTRQRVERSTPWMPPQSFLLCRHLNPATGLRIVTPAREAPRGHLLEHVLGVSRRFPAPGAERLTHADDRFALSGEQGDLGEGEYDLGYIERQRLPTLEKLEVRRIPETGQETLVAGSNDPLIDGSEPVEPLGWIEPCPILPRAGDILHTGPWAVVFLGRELDRREWRHRYRAGGAGSGGEAVQLGWLHPEAGPGMVALRLRSDGRLASELCTPGRASRDPRKLGRWIGEPLADAKRPNERLRGSASRLRHLVRHGRSRRLATAEEGEILGYLRRQGMPGCSTLYSTIHPITGDQFVTCSPEEASAAGYVIDGILGAIFDPPR